MKNKLLVVGVAVIDIVMNVDDIPTRAEKYRASNATIVGGGCGANAAVTAVRLGADCTLAARLGNDQFGDMIINGLSQEGVDCQWIRQFAGRQSSFSSVFVDKTAERQIVNYRDSELPADASWLGQVPFEFDAVLADTRWPQGATVAMRTARANGVPGILDAEAPFGGTEEALCTASHVVFSAMGLREYSGSNDLLEGLQIARTRLNNFVGVTEGANGMWWRETNTTEHMPAFSIEAVDTLGAGDVWHGAFALALSEAMPMQEAIKFSNASAALKCMKPGGRNGIPSRAETEDFIRNNSQCN